MMSLKSAFKRFTLIACIALLNLVILALGTSLVTASESLQGVNVATAAPSTFEISNPVVTEGNSGTVTATFNITRSDIVSQEVIAVSTISNTAVTGEDFTLLSSEPITFEIGEVTQTVDVLINGDERVETDEIFFLNIDSDSTVSGTATIQNDDLATITLEGAADNLIEGDSAVEANMIMFTATLDHAVAGTFEIPVSTADGTATGGIDYEPINTALKFDGLQAEVVTFTVPISGDITLENDETLTVGLGDVTGEYAGLIQSPASPLTVTITDDDQAGVRLDTPTAVNEEEGEIVFTAVLTAAVEGGFTVPYSFISGTAAEGVDYTGTSGVLTFTGSLGETQPITVPIIDDAIVEKTETFSVTLGAATATALGPNAGQLTVDTTPEMGQIQNTDTATISFIGSASTLEGSAGFAKTLDINFQVDAEVDGGFEVSYSTAEGTATGGDYQPTSGSLTFSGTANETQDLTVIIEGDNVVEADETFSVTLGSILGNDAEILSSITIDPSSLSVLGTIQNDDAAVIQLSAPASVTEGDSGQTDYVFRVQLLDAVQGGFDLSYETTGISAIAGEDFVDNDSASSQPLSFDGELGEEKTIVVKVLGDTKVEPAETFLVNLIDFANFEVNKSTLNIAGSNPVTATIAPDDGTVVSFTEAQTSFVEADATVEVEVMLSAVSDFQTEIDYLVEPVTATAGSDFTAVSGTLIFAAGDITKTIGIPIINDSNIEFNEDFKVTLSNPQPSDTLLGIPSEMIVTIEDDDGLPTVSLSQPTFEVAENGGTVPVSVTLNRVSGIPVTVQFSTADNSATAGSDFTAVSRSVVIPAGDRSALINVPITDDTLYEKDETFTVTVASLVNADPGTHLAAAVTIIENDAAPLISIGDVTIAEEDGLTDVEFVISLNKVVGIPISVNYATQDGTATVADGDYLASSGTVVIPAGQITGTIQVTVLGDIKGEDDETFSVVLSSPVDGNLDPVAGATTGNANLTNDDFFRVQIPLVRNGSIDGPDLIASQIETRSGQVFLTIRNVGTEAVQGAFWVDLFVNPTVLPLAPNDTIDSLGQPGIVWLVSGEGIPLQPGESLELTVGDVFYSAAETNFAGNIPSGSILVAHVDSANVGTTYGAIREGHEQVGAAYNNIFSSKIEADISVP